MSETQDALHSWGDVGGIYWKHFGPGVEIHYAISDPARQTFLGWVGPNVSGGGMKLLFNRVRATQAAAQLLRLRGGTIVKSLRTLGLASCITSFQDNETKGLSP